MYIQGRFERESVTRRRKIYWASLTIVLSFSPVAMASDESSGRAGVLYVSGTVTESACMLEVSSAFQDVDMGNIDTSLLRNLGDRSPPVSLQLRLQDCARHESTAQDQLGNFTWSATMPSASFSFTGARDSSNPELIQALGVGGMGLRLLDKDRQNVDLGGDGRPLLLNPGQNQVIYNIAPERTSAPLQPGPYSALIMFRLNYE